MKCFESLMHWPPFHLDSITEEGLNPMSRQHFENKTPQEAHMVGAHHASDPVVLIIDSGTMVQDGFEINKRGRNTYTVDAIPPKNSYREID